MNYAQLVKPKQQWGSNPMVFKVGDPKRGGRQKGTPNKRTREVRNVIALAAFGLGGVDRLIQWARATPENEKIFWSVVYPKLLPTLVRSGQDGAMPLGMDIDPGEIASRLSDRGLPPTPGLFGEEEEEPSGPRP